MTYYSEPVSQWLISELFKHTNINILTPTYGEVLDWFANEKNIIINIKPFFTFALKEHIAFLWSISYINEEIGDLVTIDEESCYTSGGFGGSFKLTMDTAINRALEIYKENKNDATSIV